MADNEAGGGAISFVSAAKHIAVFAFVGLTVLFLELFGEPTQRGFFCNDDTIKYPYSENTVSERTIILVAVLLPVFVILPTQLWKHGLRGGKARLRGLPIPKWISSGGYKYGFFLIGLGLAQIISCIGKFTIGRLRPHFLAVCQPDVICNGTDFGYITEYNCTGEFKRVREARLSFPSGHSSAAALTCIYLTIFLETSHEWKRHGCLRRSMQFLLIASAWWVSLSRIMDNWHHWSDVMGGVILGAIAAFITVRFLPGIPRTNNFSGEPGDTFLPLSVTGNKRTPSEVS